MLMKLAGSSGANSGSPAVKFLKFLSFSWSVLHKCLGMNSQEVNSSLHADLGAYLPWLPLLGNIPPYFLALPRLHPITSQASETVAFAHLVVISCHLGCGGYLEV
jgi:hypothetical protein